MVLLSSARVRKIFIPVTYQKRYVLPIKTFLILSVAGIAHSVNGFLR